MLRVEDKPQGFVKASRLWLLRGLVSPMPLLANCSKVETDQHSTITICRVLQDSTKRFRFRQQEACWWDTKQNHFIIERGPVAMVYTDVLNICIHVYVHVYVYIYIYVQIYICCRWLFLRYIRSLIRTPCEESLLRIPTENPDE